VDFVITIHCGRSEEVRMERQDSSVRSTDRYDRRH
jgi:hypothetical protein